MHNIFFHCGKVNHGIESYPLKAVKSTMVTELAVTGEIGGFDESIESGHRDGTTVSKETGL